MSLATVEAKRQLVSPSPVVPTPSAMMAQPPAADEYRLHTRLVSVSFVTSAPFGDEAQSAQVGRNCECILPARLEGDGSAVVIGNGQRADGVLVRRRVHDRAKGTRFTAQCFIPWSNVRGLLYGE